jgi:hypothetical protein
MTAFYRILAWLLGVKPVRQPEFDPTVKYGPALTREQQEAINGGECAAKKIGVGRLARWTVQPLLS